MYIYPTEGLGQTPSIRQQIPPELSRVVFAIRSLPEGKTCPTPAHAQEHERRIIEKLTKQGFSHFEIEAGLDLLRNEMGLPAPKLSPFPLQKQASMSPVEHGDVVRSVIHTAQVLEERFLQAERSGDIKGMTKAAEEYYKLLNKYPPLGPREPIPGRGAMKKQREKWLEARENIFRRAPNLASIVRNLGKWDLAVLQRKIAEYCRQRVLTRQRRSRVRR